MGSSMDCKNNPCCGDRLSCFGKPKPKFAADDWKARALAAEAKCDALREALDAVVPYVDCIVCYASTVDEHDGNRVAKLIREARALTQETADV